MVWHPVSSSNVDAFAADPESGALFVRFLPKGRQPARTWRYDGAAGELAAALAAPSAGRWVRYYLRVRYGDGVEV